MSKCRVQPCINGKKVSELEFYRALDYVVKYQIQLREQLASIPNIYDANESITNLDYDHIALLNSLADMGCKTIGDMMKVTEKQLRQHRGSGDIQVSSLKKLQSKIVIR